MSQIFHITDAKTWREALASGSLSGSTRGRSLAEVGYIHCSFAEQVETVANFIYADWADELILLAVDPARVPAEIRVENLDGGDDKFPHIYGQVPLDAVTEVLSLVRGQGGWSLPAGL